MKHGPYRVKLVRSYRGDGWAVVDERTGKAGQVWRTEREAEIDLARILIRDMMHG